MKGELEELGEEVDENVDSISKIQTHILNLTGGAVNIFDDEGNFRDIYNIMEDIAAIYDDLSDPERADLLETIAGKNRANAVQALILNWQQVAKAKDAAFNAAGTAEKEQEVYMESLKGKLDTLSATWQAFANDFLSSKTTGAAIDGVAKLIELIDQLVKSIGSIGTVAAGGGLILLIKNFGELGKILSGAGITKLADLGAAFTLLTESIAPVLPMIVAVVAAVGLLGAAIYNLPENRFSRLATGADDARKAIEDTKSEIELIGDELEQAQSRIKELESKKVLSLTDEAELKGLKEETKQLEAQKKIQENLLTVKNNAAAISAKNVLSANTFRIEGQTQLQNAPNRWSASLGGDYGGSQAKISYVTSTNIVEYTKKKYEELQEKQKEYNKLVDEINNATPEEQSSFEYKNKETQLEKMGKDLAELSKDVQDNVQTINDNYSSLFNDDGTVREGCEELVTSIEQFFGDVGSTQDEVKEKVEKFGADLTESYSSAIEEINKMSFDDFENEVDKVVNHSEDASEALQSIVNHAISKGLIDENPTKESLEQLFETLRQLGILSDETFEGLASSVRSVAGEYGSMTKEIENATEMTSNLKKLISGGEGNQAYQDWSAAIRESRKYLDEGAIGNGSKFWDIMNELGGDQFDVSKATNEKELQALAKQAEKFIELREKFALGENDGEFNTEGLQKWMEYIDESKKIQEALKEEGQKFQQEDDGTWTIDIDSTKLDELREKTGITENEWAILLQEVSQFGHINWSDNLIKGLQSTKDEAGNVVYKMQDIKKQAKETEHSVEDVLSQAVANAGNGATVKITGDTSDLNEKALESIKKATGNKIELEVTADTSKAEEKVNSAAKNFEKKSPKIKIDATVKDSKNSLKGLTDKIGKAQKNAGSTKNITATFKIEGQEKLGEFKSELNSLPNDKSVPVSAQVKGTKEVNTLKTSIDKVSGKSVVVRAATVGRSVVNSLKDAISGLKDKTVTVTTVRKTKTVGGGNSKKSGGVGVNGTAHATGNWGTKQGGKALLGELGRRILRLHIVICVLINFI